MLKKIIYGIVNFISVVIIAAAIVVLIMVLLTKPGKPPSIGGFTLLRITTGSMVPTYDVDTMILVQETDPSQIREGDVISFYSSDPMLDGAVNTHRVVRIEKDGGQYVYTTKGDGNNVEDPYDVTLARTSRKSASLWRPEPPRRLLITARSMTLLSLSLLRANCLTLKK